MFADQEKIKFGVERQILNKKCIAETPLNL